MRLLRSAGPFLLVLLAAAGTCAADRVELSDGKVIEGEILFYNDVEYYIRTSGGVERVPLTDVHKIDFGPKTPGDPALSGNTPAAAGDTSGAAE